MTKEISFTQKNHIGLITLQRIEALNALSLPMIQALQEQLIDWVKDDNIHAIIIHAAPGKAFCAGGDVRWLYDKGREHDPQQLQFFWHEYRLNNFIHQMKKPYIALMDGVTMGGGVGISLHGSHSVASERFVFAMPETTIGFFPDIGASYLLARCPHHFGSYLGLTGHRIGPGDAKALGLVTHTIPSEQFEKVMAKLIDSDLSLDAYNQVSECLQSFIAPMPVDIFSISSDVENCFHADSVEQILSNLAQGDKEFHQTTLANLEKKSPLSLKITFAQLHKVSGLGFADCIKLDYRLVKHFMQDHDFYEGVRALLVDKDKQPHWKPNCLSKVTKEIVAHYFECEEELSLLI